MKDAQKEIVMYWKGGGEAIEIIDFLIKKDGVNSCEGLLRSCVDFQGVPDIYRTILYKSDSFIEILRFSGNVLELLFDKYGIFPDYYIPEDTLITLTSSEIRLVLSIVKTCWAGLTETKKELKKAKPFFFHSHAREARIKIESTIMLVENYLARNLPEKR